MAFSNPDPEKVRQLLNNVHSITVVGLSPNQTRPSFRIAPPPAIVESCIKLGVKILWLQDDVIHQAAAQRAQEAGITVVMDRCMWRDAVQLVVHPTSQRP